MGAVGTSGATVCPPPGLCKAAPTPAEARKQGVFADFPQPPKAILTLP